MLRLGQRRREILIEKAPDMANALVVSTLVGQFPTDRPFSMLLVVIGAIAWLVVDVRTHTCGRRTTMSGYILPVGVMVGFVGILTLIEWLDRRRDRRSRDHAA
jgi:uncharacterized membrane protein YuzA (DUF378 family)